MKAQTLVLLAALLASAASAEGKTLKEIPFAKFNEATVAEKMDPANVYFTQKTVPYEEWQKQSRLEVEFLNLFPGYAEPEVDVIRNGLPKKEIEKITVVATRAKTILNKPASQIDLKILLQNETLAKLTPNMQHQVISADKIMPIVAGSGKIDNFSFCNQDGTYIDRPSREKNLKHALRADRPWCDNSERSVCVESCFKLGKGFQLILMLQNQRREADRKVDYGVALESEIRYYLSEEEMGRKGSLKELTGINTPIRGVYEQSMFYWNQIMQFGKAVAVFQEHPTDAQKTVVTSFFIIGIKTRTYKKDVFIAELLQGIGANEAFGVMAGVPKFTQEIAQGISDVFEK